MAEAVGSLRVDVAANVAQIKSDMGAIRSAISTNATQISGALTRMNASSMASAAAMGALRGGAIALAGVMAGALSRQLIAATAEIGDLAARLGLSTDAMQVWSFAAKSVGGSTTDIVKIFEKLNEKLGQVSEEVTPTALALGKLNLTVGQLRGLNPDEQLKTIADRLANIRDPAQRAAVATELLGDKANDMLAIFAKGRAGVEAVANEMTKFGLILSSDTIQKAKEANHELAIIGTAFGNAGSALAVSMLPALKEFRALMMDSGFQTVMRGFGVVLSGVGEGIGFAFRGIRMAMAAPEILMAAGNISDLTRDLEAAQQNIDKLVANGAPTDEALQKYADIAERLAAAQKKLSDATSFKAAESTNVPDAPARSLGTVFDTKKAEEIRKAAERLTFDFKKLHGEFAGLAEGFPDLAFGLGIFGTEAQRAYANTGELSKRLKMLESMQLALNAAQLKQDMLTPLEKYNQEMAKLQLLLQGTTLSQETYNRKVYELKEALIQAGGAGVSVANMSRDIGQSFGTAMEGMITSGKNWRDSMLGFVNDIARAIARNAIINPLVNSITSSLGGPTGLLSGINKSANGNVFVGGRLQAFADGGIVGGPTVFPMRGGLGLMGEAGPEAIMPLERGADGRLGVSGGGGSSVYNIDARGSDAGVVDRIMNALALAEKARPDPVSTLQNYRKRFPTR